MTNVVLTGATGFVGSALLKSLLGNQFKCTVLLRARMENIPASVTAETFDLAADNVQRFNFLENQDVVIHCAARVHVMDETERDPLEAFRKVNVIGTMALARAAAAAGVKRFIFLSSVKVNGETTLRGQPFRETDVPNPVDPYGVSKMEAELALVNLSKETGIEVVIIRPVLVYGPGVGGNFFGMMKWLNKGLPLPFKRLYNKRSLLALPNLVDLIMTCVAHPSAANETFLVSDGEDITTVELLRRVSYSLGRPAILLPFPVNVLKLIALVLGRKNIAQRLCDSLQVDIAKARRVLNWSPPYENEDIITLTTDHFKLHRH